jgi:hypothetical protein
MCCVIAVFASFEISRSAKRPSVKALLVVFEVRLACFATGAAGGIIMPGEAEKDEEEAGRKGGITRLMEKKVSTETGGWEEEGRRSTKEVYEGRKSMKEGKGGQGRKRGWRNRKTKALLTLL